MALDNKNDNSVSTAHSKSNTSDRGWFASGGRAQGRWLRLVTVLLLFSITILLLAIAGSIYFGAKDETDFISSGNFQAIQLNTPGPNASTEVYVGRLKAITNNYYVLEDPYYFQGAIGQLSASSPSPQPLICQVYKPYGQLIINRASVVWWENLQPGSKVVQKINSYESNNSGTSICKTVPVPVPVTHSSTSSSSSSKSTTSQ